MSSNKLVFKEDEVERLRTKIGQVSQDTNQLYLQLKGQANSWGGIPLGQNLLQAQVLINELTVDAEKLEDILRAAIKGVQDVQNENKRQMSQLEQRFSLLGGMFGRFGGGSGTGRIQIPPFARQTVTKLISTVSTLMGRDGLHSDPMVQKLQNIIQKFSFGTTESIAAQSKLKDIYEARDVIAKAQTAYEVYQAFGNNAQMNAVHKLAEDARKRLESLGVDEVQYRAEKDLSADFKQPAVKACDYDPSITTSSVPLDQDEAYLLLLRMAMEPGDKGEWAKNQLEIIHRGGQGILLANPNSEAWRGIVNQAMVQDIKNGPPVEEVRGDQGDWRSRPAKKDFIDKYLVDPLDELLTGEKPGIKTQGQQAMEAQFFAMQMEQQSVLSEFTSDFQATLRGAASADRITEVLGIGTVNLKSGTNKNGQIQSPSGMGGSGFGKIKELDGVEVGEMKLLPNHSELESVDDFNPTFKGIEGMGKTEVTKALQQRVDEIRAELPSSIKKSGNLGVAKIEINGLPNELKAHSSVNFATDKGSDGFVLLKPKEQRIFETINVDKDGYVGTEKSYSREWDTEVKILEDIASKLGANTHAKGTIDLFTERLACASCSDVILEFRRKYPNIQLDVHTGKK
ncbi:hypothetical protein A3844_30195 [Paenibacillus helianthi]|uniref:Uncharacterized protein n=1 Tax=Paenibacillus helianthi TaxID=1349432 RepID=A0ABX3EG20_9BACL|nr:deaminase domain-containing protein [Paenibacillus helianthi]OKP76543.1 hypothetical protein A3844_30195 [Paenibacillus helianthi]